MTVTTIKQHNFYQLEDGSGKIITGFLDEKSKYRVKHFPAGKPNYHLGSGYTSEFRIKPNTELKALWETLSTNF